ncbi:hypothetical protein JOE65_000689 [Arthrobacter roseus]|nr:hypothetical protein [Arthrobacter roseus]
MFVRVKDQDTKHEFDVPESDPRIGSAFELVKADRYPPVIRPRQPKYHTEPTRATTKKKVADNGRTTQHTSGR